MPETKGREAERKRKLRGSYRWSLSRRDLHSLVRQEEIAAGDDVGVEMVDISSKQPSGTFGQEHH